MPNVLIVEDNVDLANVIRSMLEFENHAVDVYHTGDEGLANILVKPYDLVILDWDLPGVTGLQILSQFRNLGATIPVLMLTGKDGIDDKEAGLDSGADDYITKPFNIKELGARIRAHLRRTSSGTKTRMDLSDISLDKANLRATKAGRTYALLPHEFELLKFAAQYPHIQPNSKDLINAAWSGEDDKTEQKLQMTIRRLRKKFDPTGSVIFPHLFRGDSTDRQFAAAANDAKATKNASNEVDISNVDDVSAVSTANVSEVDDDVDPFIGTIFNDKYEIIELIGGGGSGLVYIAKHLALDKIVALKVLHISISPYSESSRRFHREAMLSAALSHPNIVTVSDFGTAEQGQPYIVLDLLEGASLAEVLELKMKPQLVQTVNIFRQVCRGLEHAHEKGLVHRDIKPSNLMLIRDSSTDAGTSSNIVMKIVDFGLARHVEVDENFANITQTGDVLGSPPYMSPEQCRGEQVDKRSDIYSIGCAMFEAITGQPPFSGDNPVAILIKHITDQPPALTIEGCDLPEESENILRRIVAKCLEKNREDRFQSAAELLNELSLLELPNEKKTVTPTSISSTKELEWSERKESFIKDLCQRLV